MKFPRIAKFALFVAIAAIPAGFLIGMLLATGQDVAGAGMIQGIMLILGVGIAAIAGLIYLVARVGIRLPRVSFNGVKRNRWRILITIALFGGLIGALYLIPGSAPQSYALRVSHKYDADITDVAIRIGIEELSFDRIAPAMANMEYGVNARPDIVEVYWQDPAGESHSFPAMVIGGVPDRYHRGELRVSIVSAGDVRASFRAPR